MSAPGSSAIEQQSVLGAAVRVGDIVADKYRIERELGRGGMGIVFAAMHLALERLVAIKVLKRELVEDERALKRLLFEARSAAKVKSEHVARVLDVGTLPSGVPFIVMEYLEGRDLAAVIDSGGPMEVEDSVQLILQACEALAEVHASDLVHRDLKPGNLFVASAADGKPSMKIVDFGISKYVGGTAAQRGRTTSPHVLGSPFYMAPEQMRAEAVDARSDIWAVGAILFEMLTGRTPFGGETLPEVYAAVLGDPPAAATHIRPEVPEELSDVIQCCLAKDPAERYADVGQLALALAPFGGRNAARSVERIAGVLARGEAEAAAGVLPVDSTDLGDLGLRSVPPPRRTEPVGTPAVSAAVAEVTGATEEPDATSWEYEPDDAAEPLLVSPEVFGAPTPPAASDSGPHSSEIPDWGPLSPAGRSRTRIWALALGLGAVVAAVVLFVVLSGSEKPSASGKGSATSDPVVNPASLRPDQPQPPPTSELEQEASALRPKVRQEADPQRPAKPEGERLGSAVSGEPKVVSVADEAAAFGSGKKGEEQEEVASAASKKDGPGKAAPKKRASSPQRRRAARSKPSARSPNAARPERSEKSSASGNRSNKGSPVGSSEDKSGGKKDYWDPSSFGPRY